MSSLKVTLMVPNPIDVLSFYRGVGPFQRMVKNYNNVHFTCDSQFNWAKLSETDMLFAQRPYKPEHLEVIKLAKKWGKPVVVDYDDNLFALKTDNPAWKTYTRNKGIVATITDVPKYADAVIVTTEGLKKVYEERGCENVFVVPNAYDSTLFPYVKPKDDKKKIVLWRGSDTHIHDCLTIREGYEELIKKYPDWIFAFMNQYPWFLSKHYDNVHYMDGLEVLDYFKFIHDMAPAIMTHPLSDCTFNRAKSMACFLEATHAGAAFVGPDFEEFRRPGLTTYKPECSESFFNAIDSLIQNPKLMGDSIVTANQYVKGNLELGVVNKIRYNVLRSLT